MTEPKPGSAQSIETTMAPPTNSNESYCTFTLASDVTAGGLPSEEEIAKDLESSDDNVSRTLQGTQSRSCAVAGQKTRPQGCHHGYAGRRSNA